MEAWCDSQVTCRLVSAATGLNSGKITVMFTMTVTVRMIMGKSTRDKTAPLLIMSLAAIAWTLVLYTLALMQ